MRAAFLVLVAALLVALGSAAPASARACTNDGAVQTCVTATKERCSAGPPYRCKRTRDVCTKRKGRATRCVYTERRRVCRAFGGTRCTPNGSLVCASGPRRKRCVTTTPRVCRLFPERRGEPGFERCDTAKDTCTTDRRSGRFSCLYRRDRRRCDADGCRYEILECRTGTGRGKSCTTRFRRPTPASGGGSGDSGSGSGSSDGGSSTDGGTVDSEPAPADGGSSTAESEPAPDF